ncbi:MAG: SDR family NAD(P)-dependent oxidoreductase [Streptosporangiaceae bacterium]
MDLGLAGRIALITGAASGIGQAAAAALAAEGARVVLVDADKDGLAAAAKLLPGGAAPVVIAADLSTAAGVELAMTDALARTGGVVDILVSNAGQCRWRTLDELTDADWQATMDVNFYPAVRTARYLLPGMTGRRRGAVVITASDLAKQPEASPADYQASKVALLGFAKSLALAAAPHVRVNAVAPGPVWTGLWSRPGGIAANLAAQYGLPPAEAVERELSRRQLPLGRIGRPEEIADVICFLASDRASFVTGATWDVGGGSIRGLF